VAQIAGAAIPVSANVVGTNASKQLVASTSHSLSVPSACIAASASGTAYTCTTVPAFVPATGDHIQFKADVANTASATLAVNGATAAAVKKWGGSGALVANDLLAGHWISAVFDGTNWQLEGQLGTGSNTTTINSVACAQAGSCTVTASAATLTGTQVAASQAAFTGDVTKAAGSLATTVTKDQRHGSEWSGNGHPEEHHSDRRPNHRSGGY